MSKVQFTYDVASNISRALTAERTRLTKDLQSARNEATITLNNYLECLNAQRKQLQQTRQYLDALEESASLREQNKQYFQRLQSCQRQLDALSAAVVADEDYQAPP